MDELFEVLFVWLATLGSWAGRRGEVILVLMGWSREFAVVGPRLFLKIGSVSHSLHPSQSSYPPCFDEEISLLKV